ncbi:MAG: heme exporter protein CcmD [Emcibacter sp.]|nr:heme exporter protein CcmD [Emcibacter sp.]
MPEFENANDIYILSSYIAGAVVLIGLGWASWWAKRQDENNLRVLEKQLRELSDKQGI